MRHSPCWALNALQSVSKEQLAARAEGDTCPSALEHTCTRWAGPLAEGELLKHESRSSSEPEFSVKWRLRQVSAGAAAAETRTSPSAERSRSEVSEDQDAVKAPHPPEGPAVPLQSQRRAALEPVHNIVSGAIKKHQTSLATFTLALASSLSHTGGVASSRPVLLVAARPCSPSGGLLPEPLGLTPLPGPRSARCVSKLSGRTQLVPLLGHYFPFLFSSVCWCLEVLLSPSVPKWESSLVQRPRCPLFLSGSSGRCCQSAAQPLGGRDGTISKGWRRSAPSGGAGAQPGAVSSGGAARSL